MEYGKFPWVCLCVKGGWGPTDGQLFFPQILKLRCKENVTADQMKTLQILPQVF